MKKGYWQNHDNKKKQNTNGGPRETQRTVVEIVVPYIDVGDAGTNTGFYLPAIDDMFHLKCDKEKNIGVPRWALKPLWRVVLTLWMGQVPIFTEKMG